MAIKDKFSTPANETAGIIDELSIDHHIQEEFPNLASSNGEDVNLSMSEYAAGAGISSGQEVKFSDMFGLSNYTKVKFKPGARKQYYNVRYGNSSSGIQNSRQIGLRPQRNFLWSTSGYYTTQYDAYAPNGSPLFYNKATYIIDNSNINAKIPGYDRCDILGFDIKEDSTYNRSGDGFADTLYNSHRPDVRLFIKSHDEYPIFGQEAKDSNFKKYDPHWNWVKLTGKFYSRASGGYTVSSTLDTYEKTFYFSRRGAEVKLTGAQPKNTSPYKYTAADESNYGKNIDFADMGIGGTYYPHGKQYYQAKSGSWTAPLTISDLGDNVKSVVGSTGWGSDVETVGQQLTVGQQFFYPSYRHDDRGGSGTHVYIWQMPYDGEFGNPMGNTAGQYRAMFGNASSRVFAYHEMSTYEDEPNNEYTLEFLVDHPNSYYNSFGDMEKIDGYGDVWKI